MEGGINKTFLDKLLEKVPPLISIFLIVLPLILSYISVDISVLFLAIIYTFFFYKSLSMCVQFALALRSISIAGRIQWHKLLNNLETPHESIELIKNNITNLSKLQYKNFINLDKTIVNNIVIENKDILLKMPSILRRLIFYGYKVQTLKLLQQELNALTDYFNRENRIKPSEVQHVVIIPHVKEPIEILRKTMQCLADQTFNTKQINVVLAAEAVDPNGVAVSEMLKREFETKFNHIWITNHVLQYGEIKGKSSNMNWAAREAHKKILELGWDLKKTTVTSSDADSKLDKNYFAYLTYKFLTIKDPEYKYYASAMVFYNNIWRIPFYARVKNSLHSIYNVANLVRTDKLVPFSTYSASFWLVEKIDFWDPWITPEDYHLFLKGIFTFQRKVSTIPIFLKTLSDSAEGDGHWKTIKNNYLQSRRWAWGVSDVGWMIKNFFKGFFRHSLRSKYLVLHVIFDHIMGMAVSFLIILGGFIPTAVNPSFVNRTEGALLPIVSSYFLSTTLIFLIIVVLLDFFLRPTPKGAPWWKNITRVIEFAVQPISTFFLTSLPTFEANMRLLFGRYLEYYVTVKQPDSPDITSPKCR